MKAIIVIELDDQWLERTNLTCEEMFTDITIYKKESLEYQCDYLQRIYKCWCPIKPMPEKKTNEIVIIGKLGDAAKAYQNGYNDCIDEILGEDE